MMEYGTEAVTGLNRTGFAYIVSRMQQDFKLTQVLIRRFQGTCHAFEQVAASSYSIANHAE